MVCKNCEASFEGKFCSNCGQKADIHRVTLKHLFHELFHAITHADKGILLLAKDLLIRPGYVAREYLDGKRKKYFNPLSFMVITAAVSAFVIHETGYFEAMSGPPTGGQGGQGAPRMSEFWLGFFKLLFQAMAISMKNQKMLEVFLILPMMAFFSWLLSEKKKNNFAENLVLSSFIMGESNIAMILIFVPAYLIAPATAKMNNNIQHIVLIIYMTVAYRQFFKNHWVIAFLKSVAVMILYIIFFWVPIMGYILVRDLIFPH